MLDRVVGLGEIGVWMSEIWSASSVQKRLLGLRSWMGRNMEGKDGLKENIGHMKDALLPYTGA